MLEVWLEAKDKLRSISELRDHSITLSNVMPWSRDPDSVSMVT